MAEERKTRTSNGPLGGDRGGKQHGALAEYLANLRHLPSNLRRSIVRHGTAETRRSRAQTVFSNIFLHIHSVKIHRFSLRWNYTFGLGIMSAALFLILTLTGLLLMIYYEPSTELAYASMKDIHYTVPSGRLVRNVHRWGAHLMVLVVFLHMARVFFTASYKRGREFNWLVGLTLLVLTFGLSFTGYLLPWDQLAYWAVTIGTNIASSPQEITDALGITGTIDPSSEWNEVGAECGFVDRVQERGVQVGDVAETPQ